MTAGTAVDEIAVVGVGVAAADEEHGDDVE